MSEKCLSFIRKMLLSVNLSVGSSLIIPGFPRWAHTPFPSCWWRRAGPPAGLGIPTFLCIRLTREASSRSALATGCSSRWPTPLLWTWTRRAASSGRSSSAREAAELQPNWCVARKWTNPMKGKRHLWKTVRLTSVCKWIQNGLQEDNIFVIFLVEFRHLNKLEFIFIKVYTRGCCFLTLCRSVEFVWSDFCTIILQIKVTDLRSKSAKFQTKCKVLRIKFHKLQTS